MSSDKRPSSPPSHPPKRAKTAGTAAASFARSVSVSDVLAARASPRAVVCVEHSQTVGEALALLRSEGVTAAPVALSDEPLEDADGGGYLGMLDCASVLETLVRGKEFDGAADRPHEADALERAGRELAARRVLAVTARNDARLMHRARADEGLLAVLREADASVHRVALFDARHGAVTDVVTVSDALRYLVSGGPGRALAPFWGTPLDALGLVGGAARPVVTAPAGGQAAAAFHAMYRAGVSAVALVDGEGRLAGNLSATDLRGLGATDFGRLASPAERFVRGPNTGLAPRLVRCARDAEAGDAVRLMLVERVHHVFVSGDDGKPLAVVSMTDVVRALVAWVDGR